MLGLDNISVPSTMKNSIDYLVLGTITQDISPSGERSLGGTAAFAGCMARALGLHVGVVAAFDPELDLLPLEGISVVCQPSTVTTTYENRYTSNGRVQYMSQRADMLRLESVPSHWLSAPIVHLGPLANDVDAAVISRFPDALIGITPQGWLRSWDESGRVYRTNWAEALKVLPKVHASVLSIEDVDGHWEYLEPWVDHARVLIVTQAAEGATVIVNGERRQFPAPCVEEVDPTGAGDLFAAAFFIRYQQTGDPWAAARYAVRLASASVTRTGLLGLPSAAEAMAAMDG